MAEVEYDTVSAGYRKDHGVGNMTKGNFRKRRREVDLKRVELIPSDVIPQEVIIQEFQGRRISSILLEFASPLLTNIDADNFFQYKIMLYFAALSWNFSYFNEGDERKEALDKFLLNNENFPEDRRDKMYTIVNSLSIRKRRGFWQYDFLLVNYETIQGEKERSVVANAVPYSLVSDVGKMLGRMS